MSLFSGPLAELVAAFQANDAAGVGHLLDRHPELKANLDEPAPGLAFGATALLAAATRGNREMVDVLLDAGADINARSHWWAGGFGVLDHDHDADFVSFLIGRGAKVDVHAAARLGMLDRLDELLSANPELVHARGGDGQTPLHFAKTVEVAQYLLERGADIDARDVDHESTAAQWMVRDRQDVARHLVSRGCRTDILMAAALGDLTLVRRHLDTDPACIRTSVCERYFRKRNPRAGGTIYIWTLGANTNPHTVAHEFGHEEVFRLLMDRSPDELRLALACELGEESLAKALLANSPDLISGLSGDDTRRLADAAQDNNTSAVRLMLSVGWPVEVRGQHGGMALHWAAFHGNADLVREILEYDPPLEVRDDDFGSTPLGWAIYGSVHGWHCKTGDYAGTVEALLAAGALPPSSSEGVEASEPVHAALRRHGMTREQR
jgi:ankyrin repeat protein